MRQTVGLRVVPIRSPNSIRVYRQRTRHYTKKGPCHQLMEEQNRFSTILQNPPAFYLTPDNVLADKTLERQEQRDILFKWEGIIINTGPRAPSGEPDTLEKIREAISRLEPHRPPVGRN